MIKATVTLKSSEGGAVKQYECDRFIWDSQYLHIVRDDATEKVIASFSGDSVRLVEYVEESK